MKEIPLNVFRKNANYGKYFAQVDDEDFERLSKYNWHVGILKKKHYYAITEINGKKYKMHRFVLNETNPKVHVDHEDHNGLNNQKYNLRSGTPAQNQYNKLKQKNTTSKYRGVSWCAKIEPSGRCYPTWRAQIKFENKVRGLGHFKNEVAAAMAYNAKASEYFKEFANLNIIEADLELAVLLGREKPVSLLRHQLQFHPLP